MDFSLHAVHRNGQRALTARACMRRGLGERGACNTRMELTQRTASRPANVRMRGPCVPASIGQIWAE